MICRVILSLRVHRYQARVLVGFSDFNFVLQHVATCELNQRIQLSFYNDFYIKTQWGINVIFLLQVDI